MSDVTKFKHGEEGTHFACQEMLDKMGGKTGCCGCNNHDCQNDPKPMSNTKPQQECKCIKSRVYDPRKTYDFNCPVHDTPQQDTWEERLAIGLTEIAEGWGSSQSVIDFVAKQKQLSEQQGYQRGLQEALEMIGEDENSFISHGALGVHDCEPEKMKSRNQLRAELRKKLSEKMRV